MTDAVPIALKTAWSPDEQIRELRTNLALLRYQVIRLEQIIAAAGIAKRQQAGWMVESSKDVKAVFLPDTPSKSDFTQFAPG